MLCAGLLLRCPTKMDNFVFLSNPVDNWSLMPELSPDLLFLRLGVIFTSLAFQSLFQHV